MLYFHSMCISRGAAKMCSNLFQHTHWIDPSMVLEIWAHPIEKSSGKRKFVPLLTITNSVLIVSIDWKKCLRMSYPACISNLAPGEIWCPNPFYWWGKWLNSWGLCLWTVWRFSHQNQNHPSGIFRPFFHIWINRQERVYLSHVLLMGPDLAFCHTVCNTNKRINILISKWCTRPFLH